MRIMVGEVGKTSAVPFDSMAKQLFATKRPTLFATFHSAFQKILVHSGEVLAICNRQSPTTRQHEGRDPSTPSTAEESAEGFTPSFLIIVFSLDTEREEYVAERP